MSSHLHTVHVRVNDDATGQPTPVRVRFTDADGKYYAPFGRLTEFATSWGEDVGGNVKLGKRAFAYTDGSFEIAVPPGQLTVEIHKGPEYRPIREEMAVPIGKMALRFSVERWIDMRSERWYSGDIRAHFLSPHAALLEGAAEDLGVVNLLAQVRPARQRHHASVANIMAFSGQKPALEMPGHLVAVNTLNRHPQLGSLALLNCHRIVYPLTFGGDEATDDWSLADWCDQCHRKQGLVVWARTHHEAVEFIYGEPLADLILGKIDAFEIEYYEDTVFDVLTDWYRLLDCGFRVPLAGGSGKDTNEVPLGGMRTYARLAADEAFSYHSWIEAVRAGRTFVSNGPLLNFSVNDADPGAVLEPERAVLHIRATARSWLGIDQLEVLANGVVIASAPASGTPATATIDLEWLPTSSCWLAARCQGAQRLPQRPASQCVFAHSSPVYVQVADRPLKPTAATLAPLLRELERMEDWAKTRARCEDDRRRNQLVTIFHSARQELLKRAGA